jgi:aryl-alcohol dehydrogenase-like predicted oxidoreductase
MEQRRLGSTGVWVSELCLGTMMFGGWGSPGRPAVVAAHAHDQPAQSHFSKTG